MNGRSLKAYPIRSGPPRPASGRREPARCVDTNTLREVGCSRCDSSSFQRRSCTASSTGVQRTGTVLVCVLVCVLVTTSLAGTLIQRAIRSRRQMNAMRQMRQTELLLDAGVLMAADRFRYSPGYEGETWRPADAIDAFSNPLVVINVGQTDQGATRQVTVTASIGTDSQGNETSRGVSTQRTHSFVFLISDRSNSSSLRKE